MTSIARRVERLERGSIGTGRVIVIAEPDGYDTHKALTELGVTATDNDVVVYLQKMCDVAPLPRLVWIT